MKKIIIKGGGISGLTSAINLAKNGFDVEIHERKKFCGKISGDFQYLENWTTRKNVLEYLKKRNIKPNFFYKPCHEMEFYFPSSRIIKFKTKKPFMYVVRRGEKEDSIDQSLKKQAESNGVKIIFNSILKNEEADIIAIGIKKPMAMAHGITFKTNISDRINVLLNNRFSPNGYSYFSVHDKHAVLTCSKTYLDRDQQPHLKETIKQFQNILDFDIVSPKEFSGVASFDINLKTAIIDDKLYVGEAAGFQDALAGFGMRYAIESGFLAAKSIIENKNYDKLWKKSFSKLLDTSLKNRKMFQKLITSRGKDFHQVSSLGQKYVSESGSINMPFLNFKTLMNILYTKPSITGFFFYLIKKKLIR